MDLFNGAWESTPQSDDPPHPQAAGPQAADPPQALSNEPSAIEAGAKEVIRRHPDDDLGIDSFLAVKHYLSSQQ